jgi:glycosyltransferase involved in cell wall biosynthesis/2-polyprenyl-3-methyl-5-hydroxy-6-metoxy-1,4-benzoquinol methylase
MEIEEYSQSCIHYYCEYIPPLLRDTLIRSFEPKVLADLGCGDGSILYSLNRQGFLKQFDKVYAVDLSEIRLRNVSGIDSRITRLKDDVSSLTSIPSKSVDVVITNQVIEHVIDDDAMIRAVSRILKPRGIVYLTTVYKKWYGWYFYRNRFGLRAIDPTHEREYTRDSQLIDKLIGAGFTVHRNVKSLQWFAVTDFILKRIGFKQDVYESSLTLRLLRKVKLPILGYYNWELTFSIGNQLRKRLIIVTNAHAYEQALSGGERIAIELYRRRPDTVVATVYTSNFGKFTWEQCGIDTSNDFVFVSSIKKNNKTLFSYAELAISYICRIFDTLLKLKFWHDVRYSDYIYSASDFWTDAVPAIIAKLFRPRITWIAAFYLKAPSPWDKDSPYYGSKCFIGLFYWLTQLPVYALIRIFADIVLVTSQPDVKRFLSAKRNNDNVIVAQGGVDVSASQSYLASGAVIPVNKRRYDACFIGRFHYQKGVLELIDIWKKVVDIKKGCRLCMIGIGPLEEQVKNKIRSLSLENDITLTGFMDGERKFEIFKQSKIVVHPAIFDSGGMAAAEALAWGLPGVSFDLECLKTYYPKGMLKTPCFDKEAFANNIVRLLSDARLYENEAKEALDLVLKLWDWEKRASQIYDSIAP